MSSLIENERYFNDVKKVAEDDSLDFSKFSNKSILITGASGLICSFLVDVLMYRNNFFKDNIKIYLLARDEKKLINRFNYYEINKLNSKSKGLLNYFIQDVCSSLKFNIDFDFIIHGASNTHPKLYSTDPVGTILTNVIGLYNLLNYSVKHKPERILMMSSVEIYGENRGDVDYFDEKYLGYINCNTVRSGYPESKRLGESLCQSYISQYNLDIVIGRLSRVYGPTMLMNDSKALSQFILNSLNGEDIVLKSEGKQFYSYTYVADCVSAMLKIIFDGSNGEVYNISDKSSDITLHELASILAKINGRKVIFELPSEAERKGYSTATKAVMDSRKLKSLGWKPYYTIKEGLVNTIEILRDIQ